MLIEVTQIAEMPETKIKSIREKTGAFGALVKFQIMKARDGKIVVVTRDGVLKYMGNAQYAYGWGQKDIHYKVFPSPKAAADYINSAE